MPSANARALSIASDVREMERGTMTTSQRMMDNAQDAVNRDISSRWRIVDFMSGEV